MPRTRTEPLDLHRIDWYQFEKLVALAYSKTHTVERRGGANPDGGIDLIIENIEGRTAVQCKHWKAWKVGVRVVRELVGAMADAGVKYGAIITIKGYTVDASELAKRHGIKLIGEAELLNLLGVASPLQIADICSDKRKVCPKCEHEMVLRTARRGKNAGNQFWGCSQYPGCKEIMTYESPAMPSKARSCSSGGRGKVKGGGFFSYR